MQHTWLYIPPAGADDHLPEPTATATGAYDVDPAEDWRAPDPRPPGPEPTPIAAIALTLALALGPVALAYAAALLACLLVGGAQ